MLQNFPDDLESLISLYQARFICQKKIREEARRRLFNHYLNSDSEIERGKIYDALRRIDRTKLLICEHPMKSSIIGLVSSATITAITYTFYQLYKNR